MMKSNTRTFALAGLLLIVFVVVIGDMFLRSSADAEPRTYSGTAATLESTLETLQDKRRLVAAEDQILADAQRIDALWSDALRGMIKAQTASLAQSTLREHVLDAAREAAPEARAGVPRFSESPIDGAPAIRRLSLELSVTATSPADLYAVVDRIENDPTIRMGITRITMEGPGVQQGVVKSVTTTLSIEALAVVGEEGA